MILFIAGISAIIWIRQILLYFSRSEWNLASKMKRKIKNAVENYYTKIYILKFEIFEVSITLLVYIYIICYYKAGLRLTPEIYSIIFSLFNRRYSDTK